MRIGNEWFDCVTEEAVAGRVVAALAEGRGGRIITPNVDILRLANGRHRDAAEVRGFFTNATLIVADGMPLIWASRLAGKPLPQRVTGSSLIWTLSAALGRAGGSVYILGGEPPAGADRAASALAAASPGLEIAGSDAPAFGFEDRPETCWAVLKGVIDAKPDLVFAGLGFLKQERVISALRVALPRTWFLGCGAAIHFVSGQARRAPVWMQRTGLEWAHRLAHEPGRLAGRYLAHDAPYAVRLLATSVIRRN